MYSDETKTKRLFGNEGTMGLFVALYLILLTFFILLSSISHQTAGRAVAAMESVNVTFQISQQVRNLPTIDPSAEDVAANDRVLNAVQNAFIAEMELPGRFGTEGGKTFEVEFPAEYLFGRGSLRLRKEITPFLDQIVAAVQLDNGGQKQQLALLFGSGAPTVDRVMTRKQEIAIRRAGALARYLRAKGVPDGVFATGFTAIPEGQILAAFWSSPATAPRAFP